MGSSLIIDRFRVEEWGCTCFRFNLIHGTQATPPFTTTLVRVSGISMSLPFATFRGRGATSTQVSLEKFLYMITHFGWANTKIKMHECLEHL